MRLFVAVWLPPGAIELLENLPRPEIPGLRWTDPQQWHVTLRFFGNVTPDGYEVLDRAWSALREPCSVTRACAALGPATGRFGNRIIHVPVHGLAPLARIVVDATSTIGEPPDPRPFGGHVTLGRAGRRRVDLRRLEPHPVKFEWDVDEITLVKSVTGRGGASYTILERLPLARARGKRPSP